MWAYYMFPIGLFKCQSWYLQNESNTFVLLTWKKSLQIFYNSAVYTGIKKPESFSHSGFSLKVARQLPLNTPKNPNRKTHLRSVIFWNSAEISLVFCQCKRSLQSRRYYSGFWSRGTWPSAESPDRGPRRNAHYTCTVKGREKSRMRTTFLDFGFCQCKWAYWG